MKKRILAMALTLCCVAAIAACGSNSSSSASSPSTASAEPPSQAVSAPLASSAPAEVNYPSGKNLNMIIPVKAGGNMDILGRVAADYLGKAMGVNVVVQNLAGSGGIVGATQYLGEKPNTDTIIYLPANIFTVSPLFNELEFTIKDFAPITAYNSETNAVYALANGPIKSFDDLKNWDTSKTLLFGSGGVGVANHLMQASLYKDLGLTAETIPHGSAAEGLVNVIAGTTNLSLASVTLAEQYIKEGSLVPLFTYDKEDYTYADGTVIPSLYKLTGEDYDIPSLQFFAIRAGTDQQIVDYLYAKFQEVFSNPDFQEAYIAAGGDADNLTNLAVLPSSEVQTMIDYNIGVASNLFKKVES